MIGKCFTQEYELKSSVSDEEKRGQTEKRKLMKSQHMVPPFNQRTSGGFHANSYSRIDMHISYTNNI